METRVVTKKAARKGRLRQIPIYLGKFFRMFLFLDDWKVLPMAAFIAGLVSFVAGDNMFVTMEGTLKGSLAFTCICIWNGFFNSIQVVCRERDVVKREHRNGMHVSSYVAAHMIYQAFLCLLQTVITVAVGAYAKVKFPQQGFMTPYFMVDFAVTIFLITYAADMMSLAISCFVRTTTAAMTIMPFCLIFELLFSGYMFGTGKMMSVVSNVSIARWGLDCMCIQADYNSLPMVTPWNQIYKFRNLEVDGEKPIAAIVELIQEENLVDDVCAFMGENSPMEGYDRSSENILKCWVNLFSFIVCFAVLSVIVLERIDADGR